MTDNAKKQVIELRVQLMENVRKVVEIEGWAQAVINIKINHSARGATALNHIFSTCGVIFLGTNSTSGNRFA